MNAPYHIQGPTWVVHPLTDRNPFPRIDAFPRAARITRRARARYNAARYRFAEIVEVARHGLPEDEW